MNTTYQNCKNLNGAPVCGPNVIDMKYAYQDCHKLTGSPVSGENVTQMVNTYRNCYNLTGDAACGPNVINLEHAYENCYNLSGSPACGQNVTRMYGSYKNCFNLTGNPICGENVTVMDYAYMNCKNLASNAYFYSKKLTSAISCFGNRNISTPLNLYVTANTTTNTTVHSHYAHNSVVGAAITWTNAGTYQYNTAYNIYIYPVEDVELKRVENETDGQIYASLTGDYIDIDSNSMKIKTKYEFPYSTLTIDSGRCFTINVNKTLLENIEITNMEVL